MQYQTSTLHSFRTNQNKSEELLYPNFSHYQDNFLNNKTCSKKKLIQKLHTQQCDLLLQDLVSSVGYEYRQIIETTVPWVYTTAAILTHVPDETLNIEAVIKPFQWPVYNNQKRLSKNLNCLYKFFCVADMVGLGPFDCLRHFRFECSTTISE